MRVGIVCEGPTDLYAIVYFLGASLTSRGIMPVFVRLQPEADRTSPAGWPQVAQWLKNNPPPSRTKTYFDGGLFDEELSAKQCDVIVFHIDADILSHESFINWTEKNLKYSNIDDNNPIQRGNEVRSIIGMMADFDSLSEVDLERHFPAPAVESTETWCVACVRMLASDPERLRGSDLCDEFMTALHQSEGRPTQVFSQINKSTGRRRRFCEKQSAGYSRIERQCHHYRELVQRLHDWQVRGQGSRL